MNTDIIISLDDEARWQAVLNREAAFDGSFVYAVGSTGIFCKPSCPSRRPKRAGVRFFANAESAGQAGFRPCLRCKPDVVGGAHPHDEIVRRVCEAIAQAPEGIPTLDELGIIVGMSPHHLQRIFKRATGLSPRKYAQSLRFDRFRSELQNGESVSSAIYGAGFGSPSRVYENAGANLGMTPASYARGGAGASIAFATGDSPLGRIIVAATDKGVCFVGLGDTDAYLEAELRGDFPAAEIRRDDGALATRLNAVLDHLAGGDAGLDLPLDIRATAFQWRVWQTLRAIPQGQTLTYGEIAARLGKPSAARAVGRACATNPVSLIVPCHRAVGANGSLTGYRWGVDRKKELLATEEKRIKGAQPV